MTSLLSYKRLIAYPSAVLGFLGAIFIVLLSLLGPFLAPHEVDQKDMVLRVEKRLSSPNLEHPFGTDHLGTDIFSSILIGARTTISIGLGAAFVCTLLGTVIGMVTGYYGGTLDMIVMRLIDVFLAFPSLILAILIAASLGPGNLSITLALVISGWPALARIVRSSVLSLKEEEFILASKAIGCKNRRIILNHLLPNCLPLIVVLFSMRVGIMILGEASLSFLGLGSPAGTPSWGVMVDIGRSYIGIAPWCSIAPATAIAITVLFFNFFGDGLRDLLDPRLRGRL